MLRGQLERIRCHASRKPVDYNGLEAWKYDKESSHATDPQFKVTSSGAHWTVCPGERKNKQLRYSITKSTNLWVAQDPCLHIPQYPQCWKHLPIETTSLHLNNLEDKIKWPYRTLSCVMLSKFNKYLFGRRSTTQRCRSLRFTANQ